MKRILIVLTAVCAMMAGDVYGQAVTKYRIDVWFGRNNSTFWCYTLTMSGMKLNVGGIDYNIPDGVNSNNWFSVGEVAGSLPRSVTLNFRGRYTCSGSSSGTRTYTLTGLAVDNPDGCGGYYRYDPGVDGHH